MVTLSYSRRFIHWLKRSMDANFHLGKLTKNTDPTPFCLIDDRGFFKSDEVFELYLKEHGADDLEVRIPCLFYNYICVMANFEG